MDYSSRRYSFFPLLLILRLLFPFITVAQTKEMTSPIKKLPITTRSIQTGTIVAVTTPEEIIIGSGTIESNKDNLIKFNIPHIDTKRFQQAWIAMINDVRSENAGNYTLSPTLVKTSTERANYLAENRKFSKMHQRPGQKCTNYRCYDLTNRFADRDVDYSVDESIGYGGYTCKDKEDCTDELIEATKKTFKFFMSEAKRGGPHYKMVVSSKYSKVGIGVAETRASRGKAYVLVMHVSK